MSFDVILGEGKSLNSNPDESLTHAPAYLHPASRPYAACSPLTPPASPTQKVSSVMEGSRKIYRKSYLKMQCYL